MSRYAPNARLLQAAHQLELLAKQVTEAVEHVRMELAIADSYPTQTPGASTPTSTGEARQCATKRLDPPQPCPGCDVCMPVALTPTERGAEERWRLTCKREDIRDDITCIEETIASLAKTCRETIGTRLAHSVPRCDGRPYEGSDVLWVPHSRDPNNGWYDPTCTEVANASGMCNRCQVRCDRSRRERGLPPLAHARNEAA